VACGDTDISRDGLASQPTQPTHPATYPIATGKQYYSKYDARTQTTEQFVSKEGQLTFERPHVHVIHDELSNEVRLVNTTRDGDHPVRESLPGDASGNQVNTAVEALREQL
jgi:hypothetical protein